MPRRRSKRSRKSFEHYRRRRVADLKHMLGCCSVGRLPQKHSGYIKAVLGAEHIPSPEEIAKRVGLTNTQREINKLWTIPPIDMSEEQLVEQRKRKDRERKIIARRKAGTQLREAYLAKFQKPWIAAHMSRATWYRRKARGETGPSEQQKHSSETGVSAPIYLYSGHTCLTPSPVQLLNTTSLTPIPHLTHSYQDGPLQGHPGGSKAKRHRQNGKASLYRAKMPKHDP